MSTPHKHAALIHAWADGAEVESRSNANPGWDEDSFPSWTTHCEYRIKPHRWQAEIDAQAAGVEVQGRCIGHVAWWPIEAHIDFDSPELEFRIKPEMLRFRLYKWRGLRTGAVVLSCVSEAHAAILEPPTSNFFLGWIGDWQEVEA